MKKILLSLFLLSCQDRVEPVNIGPEINTIPIVKSIPNSFSKENCTWQVKFSPNGGAEEQVVNTIKSSNESLYMLSYSFTSQAIANALIEKANRVPVEVILDYSNKKGKGSKLDLLAKSKVVVYVDEKHAIAHNKTMVIDHRWLLTGSFNFTNAAEHNNAENSLLLDCPDLANVYLDNWNSHKEHSERIN